MPDPDAETGKQEKARITVVDACEDATLWTALPADGVALAISADSGHTGQGLRLDFAFTGGGYAIARRELNLDLPDNYVFSFWLRGEAPVNHLEFKLVDTSGENVWWSVRRNVVFPAAWQQIRIKKRQIGFAWGPQGGGDIAQVAAIEFAITAGSGGEGQVWIDQIELTQLPAADTPAKPIVASASSATDGHPAAAVLDKDPATYWTVTQGDAEPWLALDCQQVREYGGLTVDWRPGRHARDYTVEISDDGAAWQTIHTVSGSNGGRDHLYLPETESRYLRLRVLVQGSAGGVAISQITLQPLSWSASREAFFTHIAREARRGTYPRGMSGEQVYWTVVGADGDPHECLLSEDGALETGRGQFSVEPFLFVDGASGRNGHLLTWADVTTQQFLSSGFLPIPAVKWTAEDLSLEVTAFDLGEAGASSVLARYRVRNSGDTTAKSTLYLTLRPYQVNPPSQTLNTPGGTAPISSLTADGREILVDGQTALVCLATPARFGAVPFAGGDIVTDYLAAGRVPATNRVTDRFGAAAGVLAFPLNLPPGTEKEVALVVPLHGDSSLAAMDLPAAAQARVWVTRELGRSRQRWLEKLERVTIELPEQADHLEEILKSQLAYILINRAGPAIQPGTRAYARSWIRDGALTSAALLRLGHPKVVRDFLQWYAPHQYANGKIPCVVDARGADPVPEHDSSGEFIFLVGEYLRYTGDRALAESMWPRVLHAAAYLDSLRQLRRTAEYRTPELAEFFGILPPSISHEGYSAKPMHSYWDDFFALRGFKDAVYLAGELGHEEERTRLLAIRDEFERDLVASIAVAMRRYGIDYIPGCADLGDFDPTATTIALAPAGAANVLPAGTLAQTFARYYEFFRERRTGAPWDAYTPYEIRNVGAFVRLGWCTRAHELLDFFLPHQRPAGWKHWAEVVSHREREPRFLGDMPHTWVGSDFVRSLLSMLAYVDESADALVLGAGVLPAWLDRGEPVAVRGLPTPYGTLDYEVRLVDEAVVLKIGGELRLPGGGFVVRPPMDRPARRAMINGWLVTPEPNGNIIVYQVPATVVIRP